MGKSQPNHRVIRERATANAEQAFELKASLVELREAKGLSQADVAERMGVTQPSVSQFERCDSNPTIRSVLKYANAVDARLELRVVDPLLLPTDPS